MAKFRYKSVCIESFGMHLPETIVSSAEMEDKIAPLYKRLDIPMGTLERISGIKNRRLWPKEVAPSSIGTEAVKNLLANTAIDQSQISMLINCSVTRDYFEPSTACLIHGKLGLSEDIVAFDVTNACVGFSNGLTILANLIESGSIKAGIIVSSENPSIMIDATFKHIEKNLNNITREQLIKSLPTFTLGCGAVAFLVCHQSLTSNKPRFLGGAARTASEHADLCAGNGDFGIVNNEEALPLMQTEANALISSAAKLGGRTWKDASEVLGWSSKDVNHVFCHQVGRQVNEGFYQELGLDFSKDFSIYKEYGNMVSSAMPIAMIIGAEKLPLKKGDKVVCTAYGSGLNSIFYGIEW